jgi:signal peptidase II
MKKIHIFIIVALVLIADQALKIYVKTTFPLNTQHPLMGSWANLYFVENPGMAYGMKFGGNWGKLALTVFRMLAVIFGTWYLGTIIKKGYTKGFIICASLIYAGALGNLIDSCFYGMIFDKGMLYNKDLNDYTNYSGLATFAKTGYSSFLHGNVVDMLYFPIIHGTFPKWFPIWGGESFEFFRPIFNIADAAISTGVISILVFQKRFFKQHNGANEHQSIETTTLTDDVSQVS